MRPRSPFLILAAGLCLAAAAPAVAAAAGRAGPGAAPHVLLELYTSGGCGSCPPPARRLAGDRFFLLPAFPASPACHGRVAAAYLDQDAWTRMAILNMARLGKFSSDRAIAEYARDIWHVTPVRTKLEPR